MSPSAVPTADDDIDTTALWADVVSRVKHEYLSEKHAAPWIVGFSGGKDSTLVLHAIFESLLSIAPSRTTEALRSEAFLIWRAR